MKKVIIAVAFLATFEFSFAQEKSQDNDLKTWYHKDFATTNVYGVNTQNAYNFLESKGLKPKTIVVGVLDSGVEVDHPGLTENMWKNPKEIPGNGIDDDGNGYVDDVFGWNFLGGKNGDVNEDNLEVSIYAKEEFDFSQMKEIRYGLEDNLDVSIYAKPEFDKNQMEEIREGLAKKLKVSIYAKPEFDWTQMTQIRWGLEKKVDVSKYVKEKFAWEQMEEIRLGLEANLDVSIYAK